MGMLICCFGLVLTVLAVFLAEQINSVASQNWKRFATQHYFDKHGVFISTIWSGPLVIIALVILVGFARFLFRT